METTSTLLTWMIFTPVIGAALIALLVAGKKLAGLTGPFIDQGSRFIAVAVSLLELVFGLYLWSAFDGNQAGLQFVHHFVWIRQFNIEYFVAVDGISVSMVILTSIVSLVATLASMPWWGFKDPHGGEGHAHFATMKVPGFMAMLLFLQTGMYGVFAALDFFLFYVFWEVMLLPMYFLIGIWGGPRKEYAAIKFFLYTFAGSIVMLLAIIALYYASAGSFTLADGTTSAHTFNMIHLAELGAAGHFAKMAPIVGIAFPVIVWFALFIGFAIKVPMVPFHTWLPDAHVEAPTPISVILAGVLLKMGIYGMLRVNWSILPETTASLAPMVAVFGVINIVYAAFICMAQRDLKKLIAYSSVSHMGFCLLGMAAMTPQGINGAVLNLWTHGLISPMLFLIAGVIYDRAHHREIDGFGGLAKVLPEYTSIMGLAFFASLGLPGLAGFVSEFLVFSGSFPTFNVLTIIAATSVVITAAYYLWALQRMFLGKLNQKYAQTPDLCWRERLTLYPLGALVILFGFYPAPILDLIHSSLSTLIQGVAKWGIQ